MKNKFTALLLLGLFCTLSGQLTAQQDLFDDSFIHEIRINSTDTVLWQTLEDDYFNADILDSIPYRAVTVEIDGNQLDSVGVRQKGFSSNFFTTTSKKPLKLNFGIFKDDRLYSGVRKINLMNGIGDPALSKDKLAYDLFRHHGIPGPRVAHARLYIQDEYWGTYALIEQIDKYYLERNFADNDGNLWKNKGNSELTWLGDSPVNYTFELQTNAEENDWSKFIQFIDAINNTSDEDFQAAIDSIFHVDEYLRILAIDLVANNWDSYVEHGRNWYLYHEPRSNKIHWLPWDYNFAFDRNPDFGAADMPLLQDNSGKPLINRIMAVPEWRSQFLDYACEIVALNMTSDRIDPKLDANLDIIEPDWGSENDFFTVETVNDAINGLLWMGDIFFGNYQGLKTYISERNVTAQTQLMEANHSCPTLSPAIDFQEIVINEFMSSNGDGSQWFDQDGDHDDWIELYNNTDTNINLGNYFLSDQPGFLHKWEFPEDAIIPANDYLIVWPDKDIQQTGLHTQFRLDKDSDEIFLSHLDGSIIDQISWTDEMEQNSSLSRIPNGTGSFQSTSVTFGQENGIMVSADESLLNLSINVYPNPTQDILHLELDGLAGTNSTVGLIDIVGRLVYQAETTSDKMTIDLGGLSAGFYLLKVNNGQYEYNEKIVVE